MRIVIACDSFKGSVTAAEAARRMAGGIRRVYPEAQIVELPIADGGEGTVEAFLRACGGRLVKAAVTGPLGRPAEAGFAVLKNGAAVIEMAAASGLTLLKKDELEPLRSTTYGTGELIRAALDEGCRRIIIGIGGSATNDAGAGMARALGASLKDESGAELPFGGGALGRLWRMDLSGMDRRIFETEITAACDVANPICGENGASYVYGRQKGATGETMELLDRNLAHFAEIAKEQTGMDVKDVPGAGAAGGLGAGLMLFCGAKLKPGIDIILDMAGFEETVKDADFVITGEGRMDAQTVRGKAPLGVARRAKAVKDVPVFAITGGVGEGAREVYAHGIDAIIPIAQGPATLQEAMDNAEALIENAAERLMRVVRATGRFTE